MSNIGIEYAQLPAQFTSSNSNEHAKLWPSTANWISGPSSSTLPTTTSKAPSPPPSSLLSQSASGPGSGVRVFRCQTLKPRQEFRHWLSSCKTMLTSLRKCLHWSRMLPSSGHLHSPCIQAFSEHGLVRHGRLQEWTRQLQQPSLSPVVEAQLIKSHTPVLQQTIGLHLMVTTLRHRHRGMLMQQGMPTKRQMTF